MNKKGGFTLIELLAVIVILAIIAVIAVPIVLNIIDESKNNAGLRSAEMYVKAAEMSIAQSTLKDINIKDGAYKIADGDICLEDYDSTTKKCIDSIDEGTDIEILKVEVNGKVPTTGEITITNGTISEVELNFKDQNTIVKGSNGDLVYFVKGELNSVCKPSKEQLYTTNPLEAGYKYNCKVDPNKDSYTFYVLKTPKEDDTNINLIMDQNIKADGTGAGLEGANLEGDYGVHYVDWSDSGNANDGPVPAMQFLYNATKTWTNVEPLNFLYNDNRYTSIASTNGVAVIYPFDNEDRGEAPNNGPVTIGTNEEPLRARLPIYIVSGNQILNEVSDRTDANAFLYDNLLPEYENMHAYWTLTAADSTFGYAVFATEVMYTEPSNVSGGIVGIRPVVNLKI